MRALTWLLVLLICPVAWADDGAAARFNALADEAWQYQLRENPLFATFTGDHRYDALLPQVRPQDFERRLVAKRDFATRLKSIPHDQLSPADRLNYEIFSRLLGDQIAELEFKSYLMPISGRSGFHVEFPELPRELTLVTVQDYENYIARLRAFQVYAGQNIELMRAGIAAQMTLPADVLRGYARPVEAQIVTDAAASPLFTPFKSFPEQISVEDQARLTAAGRAAILESVVPGYRDFLAFMSDEYVPHARESIGASGLPNGREFYRHRVRHFATLDITPEQVHEQGLSEVRRIRAEMEAIARQTGFAGDLPAFIEHLRSDPKFYATSREQLLKEVSYVLKRIDGQLPKLFGKLPRTPYGVREVPEYIASQTTTAYYMPPAGDGTRAGFYYVNTSNLPSRPLFEIEALSLHEAVPGHHLQIALQQELTGVPPYRRFADFTAFIEGWGLYAERLGQEIGCYQDPYSDFGRLSYEMWRACRLVVDTGMHYLGWSRQQAIDFMAANSALTQHNIVTEVDRYIGWPGQAVAYKLGELKIRDLRRAAETELGAAFDVRAFHDAVLAAGAVPLDVLAAQVRNYIDQAKTAPPASD
ncbi:MAG: DUF885 domain-containing protein [Pirellulales bacterium]|nr:DUF885 domain-containing protein [Pirellulales bacterium]